MELNVGFREIRNYLAGRAVGITRDRSLLQEVAKCLFCFSHGARVARRRAATVAPAYQAAFETIRTRLPDLFDAGERIKLDDDSITFVHEVLGQLDLEDGRSDPVSELYQTFIGSDARGAEGQFFTPTVAVQWLVEAVDPRPGESIIDPACGAGSFLSYAARRLKQGGGVSSRMLDRTLFGVEKDEYLSRLAKLHVAFTTLGTGNVVCGDSIDWRSRTGDDLPFRPGGFDVVLANPPFGAKITVGSATARKGFSLAHKWTRDRRTRRFRETESMARNPSPQTLFLELCVRLLKPGGRMGIVVPESLISSPGTSHVVQFLTDLVDLDAVVGMPENLFKTSGKGGTHTKTCLLVGHRRGMEARPNKVFMAEAKWCGHDSRGNPDPRNDLPTILGVYRDHEKSPRASLGFHVSPEDLSQNILAPRYYDPEADRRLGELEETHELLLVEDLVRDGVLQIDTGDEVGKLAYGTGEIPFVRTSDLSNWEVKIDPKHGVSETHYAKYAAKQDVREGDILMVRDGTYLIGTCAYVSKYDTRIVYQSHLYKIRVLRPGVLSPYLLLAALSSKPVVAQIQGKRLTQDIIDTLGRRINELVLPLPRDPEWRSKIEEMVATSIRDRIEARELARRAQDGMITRPEQSAPATDSPRRHTDTGSAAPPSNGRKSKRSTETSVSLQPELSLGSP